MRLIINYKLLATLVIISCFTSGISIGQQKDDSLFELRLGTSNLIFQDVDPRDGQAAFIVYAKKIEKRIAEKRGFKTLLKYANYNTIEEIKNALRNHELDILSLTTDQYFELVPEFEVEPFTASYSTTGIFTQYVLITSNKNRNTTIKDLAGKKIDIPSPFKGLIPEKWLTLAVKNNIDSYFQEIKYSENESNSIYNVFFGKTDCALVRKSSLRTLGELNPQIGKSIIELEISPPIVPSLLTYIKGSSKRVIDIIHHESKELHLSEEGRTVLKIFKAIKVAEITKSDLESVKTIVSNYKNFLQNKNRTNKH